MSPLSPFAPAYCLTTENLFVVASKLMYSARMSIQPLSSVSPVTLYVLLLLFHVPEIPCDFVTVNSQSSVISCDPYITVALVMHSGNVV